jgi:hypothetical protein
MFYLGQNTPTAAPASTASGTGHTVVAGNYITAYTWVTPAGGETTRSPETTVTVTSGQQVNVPVPAFPANVSAANVYISPVGGATGSETKQGNITSSAGTFVLTAPPVAGTALPATSTTVAGVYGYWWTPTVATLYDVDIDEATIPVHFFQTLLVGSSTDLGIATHILALSNKGQDVVLSATAGSVLFTTTMTLNGTAVATTTVRFFNATNYTDNSSIVRTTIDFTTEVAQATTSTTGGLSVQLNPIPGYFALQFIDANGGQETWYIKYNSGSGTWNVTTSPQNP